MSAEAWIAQSVAAGMCALVLLLAVRECGLRVRLIAHPLAAFAVVLWYVTAGPWLIHLLFGRDPQRRDAWSLVGYADPTYVHVAALLSFVGGYLVVRLLLGNPRPRDRREVVMWRHAPLAFNLIALAGLTVLIGEYLVLYRLWGGGVKIDVVHAVSHPIQTIAVAFVILGMSLSIPANVYVHGKLLTRATLVLLVAFGLYSLGASQREIVIVMLALMVAYAKLLRPPRRLLHAGAWLLAALFILPVMARSGSLALSSQMQTLREKPLEEKLRNALATNNTLEMTGYVVHHASAGPRQLHGETFAASLLSLPPSITGLRQKRFRSASEWFVPYAPTLRAGYRMSMPGEGYLNFGYPGVALLYGALGALAGLLYLRRGVWKRFEGVYPLYLAIVVACVNWDTTMVTKLTVYGLIFWALMSRTRPARRSEPAPSPPRDGPRRRGSRMMEVAGRPPG